MIYIVMELVTGGDLFDRIIEKKHYQEKEARQLMINLLGVFPRFSWYLAE